MSNEGSLESALAGLEAEVEATQRTVGELAKTLKSLKSAAANGKIGDIEKNLSGSQQQAEMVRERLRILEESWTFDTRSHFETGDYERELVTAIQRENLKAISRDGRILCFPSILRVLTADSVVEIDRKKERRLRPSLIALELKKQQSKRTGIQPEKLVEILHEAYSALVANQKTRIVRLATIYDLLTLLPPAGEYSRQEFARDLLQLDMSKVRATRNGKRIRFHASAAAKSGAVLTTVSPEGGVKIYASVEFDE